MPIPRCRFLTAFMLPITKLSTDKINSLLSNLLFDELLDCWTRWFFLAKVSSATAQFRDTKPRSNSLHRISKLFIVQAIPNISNAELHWWCACWTNRMTGDFISLSDMSVRTCPITSLSTHYVLLWQLSCFKITKARHMRAFQFAATFINRAICDVEFLIR